jgi:hypothetical protein
MRTVLTPILLGALLLQFGAGSILWISYYLNADRITQEYCVNRTSPSCHGKCHMKEMQDRQESHQGPADVHRQISEPLFFNSTFNPNTLLPDPVQFHRVTRSDNIASGYQGIIFHPPRTVRS